MVIRFSDQDLDHVVGPGKSVLLAVCFDYVQCHVTDEVGNTAGDLVFAFPFPECPRIMTVSIANLGDGLFFRGLTQISQSDLLQRRHRAQFSKWFLPKIVVVH